MFHWAEKKYFDVKIGHQTELLNRSDGIIQNFLRGNGPNRPVAKLFRSNAVVVFVRILLVGRSVALPEGSQGTESSRCPLFWSDAVIVFGRIPMDGRSFERSVRCPASVAMIHY